MNAQEIKNILTDDDIEKIVITLGGTIFEDNDEYFISNTICHGGNKAKLYYYKKDKTFVCYTECGSMDILEFVCKCKDFDGNDRLFKSINWICIQLNIDNIQTGFGTVDIISDWEFINGYKKSKQTNVHKREESLKYYDPKILRIFQPWYTQEWINDGISVESMNKFNISYCTLQQRIIIPHYDITNKLIGIRGRAMLEDDIEEWGKYTPFRINGKMYNHPLSQNLYGLNHNIQAIKRKGKVMLVEAEKGVLQADTMFGDDNFTLALCGDYLKPNQKDMLLMLGVKEIIIGLDKQYENIYTPEAKQWAKHIQDKIIKPLAPYVSVYVLWDSSNLLDYKESPTDKGKDVLLQLMKQKIYVGSVG